MVCIGKCSHSKPAASLLIPKAQGDLREDIGLPFTHHLIHLSLEWKGCQLPFLWQPNYLISWQETMLAANVDSAATQPAMKHDITGASQRRQLDNSDGAGLFWGGYGDSVQLYQLDKQVVLSFVLLQWRASFSDIIIYI